MREGVLLRRYHHKKGGDGKDTMSKERVHDLDCNKKGRSPHVEFILVASFSCIRLQSVYNSEASRTVTSEKSTSTFRSYIKIR
jgi:hypothetical protein